MATSQEKCNGGYMVDVINKSDKKKFDCMLCLSIVKKATHGCSKHVFCFECLQEYIESNERKEIQYCPAGCQQTFNINELSSNDPYDQLINQIECKCSFCGWEGELYDFIQVHEGKCEEKEVPCHLCSILVKRKYIDQHLKDECSHRPVACRGCQRNFPFVDHLKHEESCEDIKVQCSFKNFGCNVEETRRNMIAHENDSNKQHLSLIAKYFTDENKQLKEESMQFKEKNKQLEEETKQLKEETKQLKAQLKGETKQLKEETAQLKGETKQLKEETTQLKGEIKQLKEEIKQLKEEIKQLKEEIKQLKEENKQLKEKVKEPTWKVNIPQLLLTEPANKFFHFPSVDEMHIKNINSLTQRQLFDCFSKNNFTRIIEHLALKCDVLNNYKEELHELFVSTKTIMINHSSFSMKFGYFFQIDDFNDYKSEKFSLRKDGNIIYIEKYDNNREMTFFISKWFIEINKGMTQIDITNPDDRFKVSPWPSLSSKYFSVYY